MVLVNFILYLLLPFEKETKYICVYSVAQIKIGKTLFKLYLSVTKDLEDILRNMTDAKSNKKYKIKIYEVIFLLHIQFKSQL
jgi:hypothetical protein